MQRKVICIGREFGSGGHDIAIRLSEKLGIKVYEKQLVSMACTYGQLSVKTLEASDEKATNPFLFQTVHEGNYRVTRGLPTSEVLFQLQSHEIKNIAARENCIFVGRCADYILEDSDADVLSVFVCAPAAQRIKRKMMQEGLSQRKAAQLIRKMDHQRRKYYEHYTGREWGNPENYHMHIDCGRVTPEEAVEMIELAYREM